MILNKMCYKRTCRTVGKTPLTLVFVDSVFPVIKAVQSICTTTCDVTWKKRYSITPLSTLINIG